MHIYIHMFIYMYIYTGVCIYTCINMYGRAGFGKHTYTMLSESRVKSRKILRLQNRYATDFWNKQMAIRTSDVFFSPSIQGCSSIVSHLLSFQQSY